MRQTRRRLNPRVHGLGGDPSQIRRWQAAGTPNSDPSASPAFHTQSTCSLWPALIAPLAALGGGPLASMALHGHACKLRWSRVRTQGDMRANTGGLACELWWSCTLGRSCWQAPRATATGSGGHVCKLRGHACELRGPARDLRGLASMIQTSCNWAPDSTRIFVLEPRILVTVSVSLTIFADP